MEKMTRRDYFEAIKVMADAAVNGGCYDADAAQEIVAFADTELARLAARAEKEKVKRAEKKAENDELLQHVFNVLTEEFQTGEQVVAALAAAGIETTKAKAVNRLGKLVTEGSVERADVSVETSEGKRKVKAYRLVEAE